MKRKSTIEEILTLKEKQLGKVENLSKTEKNKSILSDLYKNEIEFRAQIKILKYILNK